MSAARLTADSPGGPQRAEGRAPNDRVGQRNGHLMPGRPYELGADDRQRVGDARLPIEAAGRELDDASIARAVGGDEMRDRARRQTELIVDLGIRRRQSNVANVSARQRGRGRSTRDRGMGPAFEAACPRCGRRPRGPSCISSRRRLEALRCPRSRDRESARRPRARRHRHGPAPARRRDGRASRRPS